MNLEDKVRDSDRIKAEEKLEKAKRRQDRLPNNHPNKVDFNNPREVQMWKNKVLGNYD